MRALVAPDLKTQTPGVRGLTAVAGQDAGEVRELGGTRNVQGRLLRERGHDGFVHVELGRPLRERLRNEQELRSSLAACLVTGMNGE